MSQPELAATIAEQLAAHGEMLRRILAILQASPDEDGQGLSKLLEALIAEIGQNSRYLKDLTVAVATLGRDLPLDLVAAIDDNLDIPRRTEATERGDGRESAGPNGNGSQPS